MVHGGNLRTLKIKQFPGKGLQGNQLQGKKPQISRLHWSQKVLAETEKKTKKVIKEKGTEAADVIESYNTNYIKFPSSLLEFAPESQKTMAHYKK